MEHALEGIMDSLKVGGSAVGLGALARLTSAIVAQDEAGAAWVHGVTTFPALMLSATYN